MIGEVMGGDKLAFNGRRNDGNTGVKEAVAMF